MFQGFQNWFSKQEMEFSKQEMELFLPLLDLWSKNFFYKMVFICSKVFKIDFQNGKWNYSPHFKAPWSKNFLYKMFLIWSKGFKIDFQNMKWNYFSHFKASDQNVSHLIQGVQNSFSKQEMELSKQEMELFLPLTGLWSKNFFYNMFLNWSKGFKINFKTGNRIIQNGNGIISSTSRPLIQKFLLQKVSNLIQGFQN